MNKKRKEVVVLIGATSQIGQAIVRRVGFGRHIVLAGRNLERAQAAADVLGKAGFEASAAVVDVSNRESVRKLAAAVQEIGDVWGMVDSAGLSPSQATPQMILDVDLVGTAMVLDEFGKIMMEGGSGIIIASQSGHRLPALTPEEDYALAMTPVEDLMKLPMLQPDQMTDTLHAYQVSKRCNSLRVAAEAVKWGERGARVNTISPGIFMTPLAYDELTGPRGAGYRGMLANMPAKRAGTVDELAALAELLMGHNGAFITGSDILIDGGSTAAYKFGDLAAKINAGSDGQSSKV